MWLFQGKVVVNSETQATITEKGDGFESSAVYLANGNDLTVVSVAF